ncbi:MAG: hypothetical protein HY690_07175 [Chloroflexi bacterium]|nr:hypothetical protein [Chloroflexota bacterium]
MAKRERGPEALPEHFGSLDEAAEFWDSHDLADFWALTEEVHFDVDLQQQRYLVALDPKLAEQLAAEAHKRGLSTETLVNLWLKDKLQELIA